VHISVAALAGAVSLVLLRTIRPDDVRRSIDWSVLILIGGMLALGKAFQLHGLDTLVATWMKGISGNVDHPLFVVAMLFTVSMGLTQVINHLAAAVIMTPVAFSLAIQLGVSDRACFMAVLAGAEFAFMSPVAHQANAMIMGPGDYKYRDFLKCGAPLCLLLVVIGTLLIPFFWPL
jgi:di/tricarboxylate transporter